MPAVLTSKPRYKSYNVA